VGIAREQLITAGKPQKRRGFAPKGMDHMAVAPGGSGPRARPWRGCETRPRGCRCGAHVASRRVPTRRHIAFNAKDHVGMLETRVDQPEMVKPMFERFAADGDAEFSHVGEIGQAHPPRFADLTKDHLLLGTMKGSPGADAPLQSPPHACGQIGMASLHLFENRHRPKPRRRLQHREKSASGSGRRRPHICL
jgi:hypothetical protein